MEREAVAVELEIVARGFANWRARKGTSEPVPEGLWASAVKAARVHGTTTTARRLGLNHSHLKSRLEGRKAPTQEFVELTAGLAASAESVVEVEDGAGFRMRLHLRGGTPAEVAAAARELWAARG